MSTVRPRAPVLVTSLAGIVTAISRYRRYSTATAVLAFRLDRRMGGVILAGLMPSQADVTPRVEVVCFTRRFAQAWHRGDVRAD
jgi:hypothetical protein